MKHILLTLLFPTSVFLSLFSTSPPKEMISIQGSASIDFQDDSLWLNRFDGEVLHFRQENDSLRTESGCDVLLLGSSSIRLWKTYQADLSPLRVVNRGYGGATVRDILYNYPSLTQMAAPRNIVIYIGNDISGQKENVLVGESYKRYCFLMEKLLTDFPHTHIYILSVHITQRRIDLKEETLIFNALLKEYASLNNRITFVDVVSALTDINKDPIETYFLCDNLHLSAAGYLQWTKLLRGFLIK